MVVIVIYHGKKSKKSPPKQTENHTVSETGISFFQVFAHAIFKWTYAVGFMVVSCLRDLTVVHWHWRRLETVDDLNQLGLGILYLWLCIPKDPYPSLE